MNEILSALMPSDLVLDLGSRSGSFPVAATQARVLRFDLDFGPDPYFVQGDARLMPFRDFSFDAIIANHSLEHVEGLKSCLGEIRRVLKSDGRLYVAVPDASTFSDRLYRWLAHGGGHVNAIVDSHRFAELLKSETGLQVSAVRLLYTSFAFVNVNGPVKWSRRVWLIGGGHEWVLRAACYWARRCDAWLGTRWSVYGWAFYLGEIASIDEVPATNVCIRCGAAHVSEWLKAIGPIKSNWLWRTYKCPECQAENAFTDDAPRPV